MLTNEEKKFYEQNGYVAIPDLLSKTEIDSWLNSPFPEDAGLGGHFFDEKFAAMVAHPKIKSIVTQLLGGDPAVVQTMWMAKGKGDPGVAMHQDYHYIKTSDDTLMACWLAFDDANEENGGLRVVPGSHKVLDRSVDNGLYPIQQPQSNEEHASWVTTHIHRGRDGTEEEVELHSAEIVGLKESDHVCLDVKAGTAVFFSARTIHGSYRNNSGKPRRVFATHYVHEDTWVYRADIQRPAPLTGKPLDSKKTAV